MISGPYGNLWRGGRALQAFPFSQQASLPRPTPKSNNPKSNNRRDAQDDFNFQSTSQQNFGVQFMNRQFSASLPELSTVKPVSPNTGFLRQTQGNSRSLHPSQAQSGNLQNALAVHAQGLKAHEAQLKAQLALMGISKQQQQRQQQQQRAQQQNQFFSPDYGSSNR